jgi:hypothetical protein
LRFRTIQQAVQKASLDLRIAQYARAEASPEMLSAAIPFERRFSIEFGTLTYFSKHALSQLHREDPQRTLANSIQVASSHEPSIVRDIDVLTDVANGRPAHDLQVKYFESLISIYSKLPAQLTTYAADPRTLMVGIEREGRIIAEALGCLPESHSLRPHAKRIWFEDGLLVGFTGLGPIPAYKDAVVIDGAIASGATIIALLEHLRAVTSAFHVLSAHATAEGLRAISRYAEATGLLVKITVGHVTEGLNDHFYATLPRDPRLVVVGDLGDTISGLTPRQE